MILHRVCDLDIKDVLRERYDIGVFASGYELRCTHVPRRLEKSHLSQSVAFGFEEVKKAEQRLRNDEYFRQKWGAPIPLSTDDDGLVYDVLRRMFVRGRTPLRLLVDYSSMSRLWYAAVLNWARFAGGSRQIIVDLLYAVGDHKAAGTPMVINEIACVPACEGVPRPLSKSVAVFGLGFEGLAALCVLDRLEPHELYCYFAAPAAFEDYPSRARAANRELIGLARACVPMPLGSVERCFRLLSELISPHRFDANIALVPMGPKPHVLSAILLAMRFGEVTCLRVGYRRERPQDVGTTGSIVATRVEFIA